MKITVRKNQPKTEKLLIKDVPVGYVFEIDNSCKNTVKALRLKSNKFVLLTWSSGNDWFEIGNDEDWYNSPIKILGKLTEIIVEED